MTNRLFTRTTSALAGPSTERPLEFSEESHLALSVALDEQMLELELLHVSNPRALPVGQQAINRPTSNRNEDCKPVAFDDFGLVQGLEIDVRWM